MAVEGKSVFFSSPDGLRLHAVDYGRGAFDALPVVCLPGLSRNVRDFSRLAEYLSGQAKTRRRVVAFDYRGRGHSQWDKNWKNYNILTESEDVIAGMAALGLEHAAIIGTSRGGLIAMTLSALRPGLMKAVVLNDVGPVLEGDGLTQIRAYLTKVPKPRDWDDAVAIQKATMGKAFPALTEEDWQFEARAKYRELDGVIQPDHDPALVKTLTTLDLRDRLPTMWPQFQGLRNLPVLLLRGENSTLLAEKTAEMMEEQHPRMRRETVSGQGHVPMLHTAGIPERIAEFLEKAGH
ncbi:alpha/beta fold hydrolase [Oricola cellulosilytica]|uniref:Alpha/beta hydrolase n=1 Tax=Oricola cellulosilytica TaxID=1429082 RepID=A0A4R0PCG5_9HYPH|nr:alpha/beta hydrolase [Oricola cellulosilytica]TCD14223.1 alpha/beta hydrolase [Oricola cellulosilytica]